MASPPTGPTPDSVTPIQTQNLEKNSLQQNQTFLRVLLFILLVLLCFQ